MEGVGVGMEGWKGVGGLGVEWKRQHVGVGSGALGPACECVVARSVIGYSNVNDN